MNIPLSKIECHKCKKENFPDIWLGNNEIEFNCDYCGEKNTGYHEINIGRMLLFKSHHELEKRKDYSMSIVLSAMAFECQLAFLYIKWKEINVMEEAISKEQKKDILSSEHLEILFRKLSSIKKRIKEVEKLLYPHGGIEGFIKLKKENFKILDDPTSIVKKGSIIENFEEIIFWPRNAILHQGKTTYNYKDACNSYNTANFGIIILEEMDKYKRKQYL